MKKELNFSRGKAMRKGMSPKSVARTLKYLGLSDEEIVEEIKKIYDVPSEKKI